MAATTPPPPVPARATASSFLLGRRRRHEKGATEPQSAPSQASSSSLRNNKPAPRGGADQEKRQVSFTPGPTTTSTTAAATRSDRLGPPPVARVPAAYRAASPVVGAPKDASFYSSNAPPQSPSYAGTTTRDFRQAQNAYSYHKDGQTYANVANEYIYEDLEASYFNA
jgi:hypothetical protein